MTFILNFVCVLMVVLQMAILARALISWIPSLKPDSPIVVVLNEITEPVIAPIRSVMPRVSTLDLSPLIALILLQVLHGVVCQGTAF